jgi:hypothetical protein
MAESPASSGKEPQEGAERQRSSSRHRPALRARRTAWSISATVTPRALREQQFQSRREAKDRVPPRHCLASNGMVHRALLVFGWLADVMQEGDRRQHPQHILGVQAHRRQGRGEVASEARCRVGGK